MTNTIKRTINSIEYIFYGPNATLMDWMDKSDLAHRTMKKSGLKSETMFRVLANRNPEDKMKAGKVAIEKLWYALPELGPYPFLDTLSDFEFNRKFYPDYRQHVNHQLLVFWLGLYFFDNCGPLRKGLLEEIGQNDEIAGTEEFMRRWTACAIYHDIGYILENEDANEPSGEAWKEVCRVINNTLRAPLSKLPLFKKDFPEDAEHQTIEALGIFRPIIKTLRSVEFHKGTDILNSITEYGLKTGLCIEDENGISAFRKYYDYAFSHKSEGGKRGKRPRFREHGIVSAIFLLKIWTDFIAYVKRVCAADYTLLNRIHNHLQSLNKSMADCEKTMLAAAGAIALHNIIPGIWDRADTLANGLTLQNFQIRLYGTELTPPLAPTPLAFLLGLADTLQSWNRFRFRAIRKHDTPGLSDQDMQLGVKENKNYLSFNADTEYRYPESNPKSRFSKIRENLKEYLDKQAIDDLFKCGELSDSFPTIRVTDTTKAEEIKDHDSNDIIRNINISWEHIDNSFKKLEPEIKRFNPDVIVGLADGRITGAIIAANCRIKSFYVIDIPIEYNKDRLRKDEIYGEVGDIRNKKVLLVDNHIYTGTNMKLAYYFLKNKGPDEIRKLVFFKHIVTNPPVEVDYYAYIIEGDRKIMPWSYTKEHDEAYLVSQKEVDMV